ncbi:hypothetical protein ACC685_39465, partial [Rhizobium ruizarguesonis]
LKDRYPDVIEDIRGEGLLLGIKAAVPSAELLQAIRAARLLGLPAGDNVIRRLLDLGGANALGGALDAGKALAGFLG